MSSFRVSFYIFQSIIQPLTNTNTNNHNVSGPRATAIPLRDCSCTPGTVHRFGKLGHILGPPLRAGRYRPTVNILPVSFSYMKDIVEAMEFFTEFCVLLFAKGHGAPYTPPLGISNLLYGRPKEEQRKLLETCLPLSMWNKHRIRRALLRFQLYCELFHQLGESLASDNKDDWEGRLSEQELFWLRYE